MSRNRFLLRELVRRDIEERYRGSVLGVLWSLVEPAWQLLLFTFVFAFVLRIGLPGEATDSFPIFLFAGLIAWTPFRQGVERATASVVSGAPLIKNNRFPAGLFVLSVVSSEALHGLVATGLFVVVLAITGSLSMGSLPLLAGAIPLQLAFTLGLALIVSASQVYLRDIQRATAIGLNTWFYLTPIVYPLALVPESFRPIVEANPMTGLVELYRSAIIGGGVERGPTVALLVGAALMLATGWMVFSWLESGFVDEV